MEISHLSTTPSNPKPYFIIKLLVTFLIFVTNPNIIVATPTASTANDTTRTSSLLEKYQAYIRISCSTTIYQELCFISLSPYASNIKTNPKKLCNVAMLIALNSANNASSTAAELMNQKVLTGIEAQIVKDCVRNIKDSIYELKQSMQAMNKMSGSSIEFQKSNVKTWVSAAITDENTCTDGFDGENVSDYVKMKIRNCISNVARLTSNALALVNALKY